MQTTEDVILENLKAFTAFARKRVGDPHLAEDLVQESLLKAMQAARKPAPEEDVVAWFYRILRRSIIDLYRRNEVRERALEEFESGMPEEPDVDSGAEICRCFKVLMAGMPGQYQELLNKIDLGGREIAEVAAELGETANNTRVRLHRARKQLRERVEQVCKACSVHGCIDCTCDEGGGNCE